VACPGVNITFTLPYLYLYSGSGCPYARPAAQKSKKMFNSYLFRKVLYSVGNEIKRKMNVRACRRVRVEVIILSNVVLFVLDRVIRFFQVIRSLL
jgi:hypothetical protein